MAPANYSTSFHTTLITTLTLLDQFRASLSNSPSHTQTSSTQSPLLLLTASTTSLKQTTTRISLLTITAPFTPSALAPLLDNLNTSVLPSLLTAIFLITPDAYTAAFSAEAVALGSQTLLELKSLLTLVESGATHERPQARRRRRPSQNALAGYGRTVTPLLEFAAGGLCGFVTKRVGQWLELMKDAVKELEAWDPAEEFDPDDPLVGLDSDEEEETGDNTMKDSERATIQAGVKTEALKVLTRIPQSVHVVVKQRLAKLPTDMPSTRRSTLDALVSTTKQVSENIDESAEAMYMGDMERCLKMAGEARAGAIRLVEAVVQPWGGEGKEDIYIKRALEWIRQVEPNPGEKNGGSHGQVNAIQRGIDSMKIA